MSPMTSRPLTLELILLGLLRQGSLHGYSIHQQFSARQDLGMIWRIKQSQLYALLAKLEGRGLVTSALQSQEPRPPRKMYSLTAQGVEVFRDWLSRPVPNSRQVRQEFMAKMFFARQEGEACLHALVQAQRASCQQWLAAFQAQAEVLQVERPYEWLIYQYRIGQVQAILEWLDIVENYS
ncbi:MAG: PadR family transcriptional regulator [Chloroflexota bacterium]